MAEIVLSNKMSAKYNLIGTGNSDVYIETVTGTYIGSEINIQTLIRGEKTNSVNFDATVVYPGTSEVLIEVIPKQFNSVLMEAFVNPHNRMSAIYELIEAPYTELTELPVKDTFVTEKYPYNTINYGTSNSLKIGQDNNGENKAFIQFDLSEIPIGVDLRKANLRLYYNTYNGQTIDVSQVLGDWSEYGLTWNSVNFGTLPRDSSMVDEAGERYIDIDISDLAKHWVAGANNYGLMLTSNDPVGFYKTRESELPPQLIISYYRPGDYEIVNSKVEIETTIRIEDKSEVYIDADVKNTFTHDDVWIDMFAHQPDERYPLDADIEVTVPQYSDVTEIPIEIKVMESSMDIILMEMEVTSYSNDSDVLIDVAVAQLTTEDVDIDVIVPEYNSNSDVEIEAGIIGYEKSYVEIEMTVPGYSNNVDVEIEAEINGYQDANVDTEIEVQINGYERSDVDIEVDVNSYAEEVDILIEVNVMDKASSEVDIEVTIPVYTNDSDVEIDVDVPVRNVDNDIMIEAGVLGYADSEVLIDMYPRVSYVSDVYIQTTVYPPRRQSIYVYMI